MQSLSQRDKMMAVAAVALILFSVIAIYRMYMSYQIHVVSQVWLPPGSSEKGQAMKKAGVSMSDGVDPTRGK